MQVSEGSRGVAALGLQWGCPHGGGRRSGGGSAAAKRGLGELLEMELRCCGTCPPLGTKGLRKAGTAAGGEGTRLEAAWLCPCSAVWGERSHYLCCKNLHRISLKHILVLLERRESGM